MNKLELPHLKHRNLLDKYSKSNIDIKNAIAKLNESIISFENKPNGYLKTKIESLSNKIYLHIKSSEEAEDMKKINLPHLEFMQENGIEKKYLPTKIKNKLTGCTAQTGIYKKAKNLAEKEKVKDRVEKMSEDLVLMLMDYVEEQEQKQDVEQKQDKKTETPSVVKEPIKEEPKKAVEQNLETPNIEETKDVDDVVSTPKKKGNVEILEDYINGTPETIGKYPAITINGLKKLGYDFSNLKTKGENVKDEEGNVVFMLRKGQYEKYYKIAKTI